jgi:hypothetical protein
MIGGIPYADAFCVKRSLGDCSRFGTVWSTNLFVTILCFTKLAHKAMIEKSVRRERPRSGSSDTLPCFKRTLMDKSTEMSSQETEESTRDDILFATGRCQDAFTSDMRW